MTAARCARTHVNRFGSRCDIISRKYAGFTRIRQCRGIRKSEHTHRIPYRALPNVAVSGARRDPKSRSKKMLSWTHWLRCPDRRFDSHRSAQCGSPNTAKWPIVTAFVIRVTSPTPNGRWLRRDSTGQARRPAADVNVREVLNAIFYVLSTGCQWQALPKDLPPKSTAHYYFMLWDWDGTLARIHHALYVATREQAGRGAEPDCGDHRQSECQGGSRGSALDPQGYDAGKKVTGRKRHILVDMLLGRRRAWSFTPPTCRIAMAPARCCARRAACFHLSNASLRMPDIKGRRWKGHRRHRVLDVADRQARQCTHLRRLAQAMDCRAHVRMDQPQPPFERDFERYARTTAAFIRLAMIRIMLRRLTAPSRCS